MYGMVCRVYVPRSREGGGETECSGKPPGVKSAGENPRPAGMGGCGQAVVLDESIDLTRSDTTGGEINPFD